MSKSTMLEAMADAIDDLGKYLGTGEFHKKLREAQRLAIHARVVAHMVDVLPHKMDGRKNSKKKPEAAAIPDNQSYAAVRIAEIESESGSV